MTQVASQPCTHHSVVDSHDSNETCLLSLFKEWLTGTDMDTTAVSGIPETQQTQIYPQYGSFDVSSGHIVGKTEAEFDNNNNCSSCYFQSSSPVQGSMTEYDYNYNNYVPFYPDSESPDSSIEYIDMNTLQVPCSDMTQGCTDDDDNSSVILDPRELGELEDVQTTYCYQTEYQQQSFHTNVKGCLPRFEELRDMVKPAAQHKRGRPVTYNKHGSSDECDSDDSSNYGQSPPIRGGKRGAKNVLLWKFILEELAKPNATHVKWEDKKIGTFRFVDTQKVSQLWGEKKRKHDMNFEKLSRGIRHYYKDGLMSRLENTRLVYKFHWDKIPKQYRRQHSIGQGYHHSMCQSAQIKTEIVPMHPLTWQSTEIQ